MELERIPPKDIETGTINQETTTNITNSTTSGLNEKQSKDYFNLQPNSPSLAASKPIIHRNDLPCDVLAYIVFGLIVVGYILLVYYLLKSAYDAAIKNQQH